MTDWKIPLYKIYSDDEDLQLITKIIRRGRNWALGPEIEEFEKDLSTYVGVDYCTTLNSGTSALHASLLAYEIKENDEVIVPSFSFISTANSILFVRGTPKFSDIEEKTFGLDPEKITPQISDKTKIIMPMDYGGLSCQINELQEIAKEKNLILIEDAAESLGSTINGNKVGSISDCSIFSFCGNKVLTTGEGGALVTNDKKIYEKVQLIRSHGRTDQINYFNNPNESEYVGLGYNWRMSTLTAALGITQLHKLDKIIKMRKDNAEFLSHRLRKFPEIKVPESPLGYSHIFQMYTIQLANESLRNDLHSFLLEKGIFSKIYFNPIHQTQFYKTKFNYISLPITEKISKKVLTLPMYPNMTKEEKMYVVNSISEFFEKN